MSIGLVRAKARIGLKNLAYNMRRLVQLERLAAAAAAHQRPAHVVALGPEDVLHPSPHLRTGLVAPPLALVQRLVAMPLAVDPALQTLLTQLRLDLRRPVGAVRPHVRSSVVRIQDVLHDLAVVHRRVGHLITPHQLVAAVHIHMVLVAVMALAVLLGPPRVRILLATLGRLLLPALRRLAILDPRVLVTAVALLGDRNDRGVDDLAAHRQVAPLLQRAVEGIEQRLDHPRLRQVFAVEPHRLGVGNPVLKPPTPETA